jgi:transcriptional regulator with AAA-type ATPase domain
MIALKARASQLFSPRTPISRVELFSGRARQIVKLITTIHQPGAHAIIFGERGVGKTSLASVAPFSFSPDEKPVIAPRVNCDGTDSYDAPWRKVLAEI